LYGIDSLEIGNTFDTCKQDMAMLESNQSGYAGSQYRYKKTATRFF
jgi:hypothetical protein